MKTLIIVDVQNDFLPGGALAVREGDRIVPIINALMPEYDQVLATQDAHPADHGSFAANHPGRSIGEMIDLNGLDQILWPVHCVQGTAGAAFAPHLDTGGIDRMFQKGTDPGVDSYSGFFDHGHRHRTGLADYLRKTGATEVHVVGLATDYCVKYTALDAVAEGFATTLITDACRGVDLTPGDVEQALRDLTNAGVTLSTSDAIVGDSATLYRPTGPEELALVEASGYTAWPPRLPGQPFFYPVTNQAYAEHIAREWNARDGKVGYVTRFQVRRSFLQAYSVNIVGARHHAEHWIPADDLEKLNHHLIGRIEVVATFSP